MISNVNFMENIELILFDLDDTLISEAKWYMDKWKKCDSYIKKKYNIVGFYEKISQIISQHGFDYPKKVDDALIALNVCEKNLVQEIVNYYLTAEVTPTVFSNTHKILTELNKNFHLGIITSGKQWEQELKIKLSGFEKYFSFIHVVENKSKDSSELFFKPLNFFNILPENTLYVGNDPQNDFVGAKNLKIKTIRLLQGIHKDTHVTVDFDADLKYNSLEDFNNHFSEFKL
jgi:putative hydrolase of the HAD superfamily